MFYIKYARGKKGVFGGGKWIFNFVDTVHPEQTQINNAEFTWVGKANIEGISSSLEPTAVQGKVRDIINNTVSGKRFLALQKQVANCHKGRNCDAKCDPMAQMNCPLCNSYKQVWAMVEYLQNFQRADLKLED